MKRTAVIVGPDRTTRLQLSSIFSSDCWWVGEASSLAEANALVATFRVDLLFIDLFDLNAGETLTLCQRTREVQVHGHTRIVVLASDKESTTIGGDLQQVVDAVCRKPISSSAVLGWLDSVFPNA